MRLSLHSLALLGVLVGMLLVSGPRALATPPEQTGDNLLVNPSFEEGFRQTALSSYVANGWYPWYYQSSKPGEYYEPEWKVIQRPADDGSADLRSRLQHGNRSQQWFNTYALHEAGLWQRVRVPANATLRFSAWVQMLSSRSECWVENQMVSCPGDVGNYQMKLGIDPTGWQPPQDANGNFVQVLRPPASVIWGDPVYDANTQSPSGTNQWAYTEMTATAQGEWVTVWIMGWNKWAYKYEAAFVDNTRLVVVSAPSAPRINRMVASAPIQPTSTPTNTPTPTSTPTNTPTPTHTPTPTYTPTPTWTPTFTPSPTPTSSPTPLPSPTATRRPTRTPVAVRAAGAVSVRSSGSDDLGGMLAVTGVSVFAVAVGVVVSKKLTRKV